MFSFFLFFVFFLLEIPSNPLSLCLHSWLPNQFSHSQPWSQRILLLANWNLSIMLWCPSSNKKQQPGNTYTVPQIIGNKHVQLNNSARKHQRLWKQSTDSHFAIAFIAQCKCHIQWETNLSQRLTCIPWGISFVLKQILLNIDFQDWLGLLEHQKKLCQVWLVVLTKQNKRSWLSYYMAFIPLGIIESASFHRKQQ